MFKLRMLLLTSAIITGFAAYKSEARAEMSEQQYQQIMERLDQVEKKVAVTCLVLMEKIEVELVTVYVPKPDVNERTLRLIQAFEGFCKNM